MTGWAQDFAVKYAGIVHANYILNFPYDPIKNIKNLLKITDVRKRLFLFDEMGIQAHAREHSTAENIDWTGVILQLRKMHGDVLGTAQNEMQVDAAVRRVTGFFVYPSITKAFETKDGDLIPLVITAEFCDKELNFQFRRKYDVTGIYKLYNTFEVVEKRPIDDIDFWLKKYSAFDGSAKDLEDELVISEKMRPSQASRLSRYITRQNR